MSSTKTKGIIFTDFDGTLYDTNKVIHPENYIALEKARIDGFLRVIATGRSLFSFQRAASKLQHNIDDYVDFLIFSSGAGTLRCNQGTLRPGANVDKTLIGKESLTSQEAFAAASLFFRHGIDFMIHSEVPMNHHFVHVKSNGSVNPDYYKRLSFYSDFAVPLLPLKNESDIDAIEKCCNTGVSQLVAILPPAPSEDNSKYASDLLGFLKLKLPECSVIRTTSPIDHKSLWIEIFNQKVSKSKAAEKFSSNFGINAENCLAVGNDYNDEDLLAWAGLGMTVEEAPEQLKKRFPSAGSSTSGAVAKAIEKFLNKY